MLKDNLDLTPKLQKHLFEKGFFITTDGIDPDESYPFYGNWRTYKVGNYSISVHSGAQLFSCAKAGITIILIGHAYNPYSMEYAEEKILDHLAEAYGTEKYLELVDELTGVFFLAAIVEDKIEFMLDASGMQYGCYGEINGKLFIASHMRLAGDIYNLKTDDYVERLVSYRWYRYMMGNYLPGELTCYKEFKRIIPNTYVSYSSGNFAVTRFYPNREIQMCNSEGSYHETIEKAAKIMQNTMSLIAKKWPDPAISLTGGIDSNTTFAAANGLYDRFKSFSYISMFRESVDAEKAREISKRFGVQYSVYNVPDKNEDVPDFNLYKAIFEHNDGDIGYAKDDDTRKKITLIQSNVCDVEVKSWISETIRAYAYKYFGRKSFPARLKPRNYTSLYKIFLLNRRLVWETDRFFADYLRNTRLQEHMFNYDETDFFVWEMMHGGKCGLNIGVMKSCFDITIPYNNRKLLDLLLRVPLEKRISDQHHLDLKKLMNRELYDMNIRVVNLNETSRRKKLANIYYSINSILPF